MAKIDETWKQREPKAKRKGQWRVVIECYTEYTTVVEAGSVDEAGALATDLFAQEDLYHGERWEHLGDLYRVKAAGREASCKDEITFLGPDVEYPAAPAKETNQAEPSPKKRGRPRKDPTR